MKKIITSLVLGFATFLFHGCNSDDPGPDPSLLIGAWEAVGFISSGCADPNDNENYKCTSACEILVINASTVVSEGEEFNYRVKGNTITIDIGGDQEILEFTVTDALLTFTKQYSAADGHCKEVSTFKKFDLSVSDIDGNRYRTVVIGSQVWMAENLKTTRYNDGTPIPNFSKTDDWLNTKVGAFCEYDNNANTAAIYGNLYNGFVAIDTRNVCPSGFHVPALYEWDILVDQLGGEDVAGGKMKSIGTIQGQDGLWYSPNTGATNSSGFKGLPGGVRFDAGDFRDLQSFGHWLSSDGDSFGTWSIRLQDTHTKVEPFYMYSTNGRSIRCVRD